MFNPKVLIITAAVGFVLSFLAGLFSGISFGYILLRALNVALLIDISVRPSLQLLLLCAVMVMLNSMLCL